jgi:hypothetical protein
MYGRILRVVSRFAGTSTVGVEAIGQTIISVDSIRDFPMNTGFVDIGGGVKAYTAVDRINSTITLAVALTVALQPGQDVRVFPYSSQRWAFVQPDNMDGPSDAVWALLPHALAAFVDADGPRTEGQGERIEYLRNENTLLVTDVKDRLPAINPDAIPEGAITETKIAPESITTPLLAANAVATQNLQFGAATGDKLDVNALDGKTLTGAIIRTSATGKRIEITPTGLVQKDDTQQYLSIGDVNKFTGDIDATSEIIRDSLQLFGRNNLFAVGSKVTLKASAATPAAAPTLSSDYEPSPLAASGTVEKAYNLVMGAHADSDGSPLSFGGRFFTQGWIAKGNTWYGWTGNVIPYGYTRAATPTNPQIAVVVGEDYSNASNAAIWAFNDSAMNTSGTAAPTLMSVAFLDYFNAYKQYKVGRMFHGSIGTWQDQVVVARLYQQPGYTSTLEFNVLQISSTTGWASTTGWVSLPLVPWIGGDEHLVGVSFGSSARMGFAGTDKFIIVVNTDKRNMVFNYDGVYARDTNLEWPIMDAVASGVVFTIGSLATETAWGGFRAASNSNALQPVYKYTDWDWSGAQPIYWGKFAWRGHTTQTFRSPSSAASSIGLRKRSRMGITVPGLPAPIAGVGAARDPAKDVYGWEYYIGTGSTLPANGAFWKQTVQPSGDPTTTFTLFLTDVPLASGTNPPTTSTFPAAQAATIESDNGLLSITGDGKVTADELLGGAIDKLYDILVPIGTLVTNFTGVTPYRCLKLTDNPVAVSRTTYAALFAAIGTTWGAGNGSTTFDLPGVSGRSLIGVGATGQGNTYTLAMKYGSEAMQSHTHATASPGYNPSGASFTDINFGSGPWANDQSTQAAGTGTSGNVHPVIAVHHYIRY